ncbi:hypothetical protein ABRP18_018425 (plasmid) [Microbacterium sp. WHRI 7836]|uniref:hypothetical protein n=1 Tax=Microbacterium sp. WHRI 7836 TaxID=3162563 RepID=UPI0035A8C6F9
MITRLAWNPIDDILGGIGDWFTDVLRNTVSALIQGVSEAVKWVSTYFLYLPAPVLEGEGAGWSPAERVQAYTDWAVIIGGMIGMAFALIMVARRKDADSAVDVMMGFFRVILVTGAGIPTISLLAKFFDQAAPWLINNIAGGTFEEGLGTLVGVDAAAASSMGVGTLVLMLVSLVFGVLGGILNLFMVMFNWGVLPVVAGLLPVLAAAAMSERGRNGFNRVLAWTAAILLFKPVAAVIYGVGIASGRMITGGVEDAGQIVLQSIYGTVLLCAAGIALPAIARIVAPAIAAGTQGGGAGLLIGAGMVAAGAVTGGAAAVAAAGARGAGMAGAGKAATAAAPAPSGASSTAGPKGGASSGPSGASSGSGGGPSGAGSDGGSSSGGGGASGGGGSSGGGGPSGGGGGSAPSGAGPSGGAPATRGSQWAKRWAANGAYQTQAQIGAMEQAVEAGDER